MKKQVILEEEDIKQFHSDAQHLEWLFNRMAAQGNDIRTDYMLRFARIVSKLQEV